MGSGQRFSITLTGGSPWGFRLFGGESLPLQVAKVRKRSKADQLGMKEEDVIVSINGISMAGKSHQDAMFIVDNTGDSITFDIFRNELAGVDQPVPVVNGFSNLQADDRNPTHLRTSPVAFGKSRSPSPYLQQTDNKIRTPGQDLRARPIINNRSPSPYQPQVTESAYSHKKGDRTTHVQTRQFQGSTPDGKQTTVFQHRQVITQTPKFKPKQVISPSTPTPNVWHPVSVQKENRPPKNMPHFAVRNIKETISLTPSPKGKQGPPVPPKPLQERRHFEKNITDFERDERQYIPDPCMFSHDYHFPEVKVVDVEDEIIDTHPVEDEFHLHHHLPVFAPKVEICYEDFVNERDRYNEEVYGRHSLPPLDLRRITSLTESEATGPGTPDTESTGFTSRKKKMYSDSAFFDNPDANYPTIEEQMQLCKAIAQSLTSAANRKARGAKMFAKRKRKSAHWVHQLGRYESLSTGDIADLHDLDSEFYLDEGGDKPLFAFRIPNIKNRLAIPDPGSHRMSLSQSEFERLRLNKKRCDHRTVSPNTCHNLVADLQSTRNRGAKLFQKRQARSEKWVIDDSNAQRPAVAQHTRLESMISPKPMSPWQAALGDPLGTVDGAFGHIDDRENLNKVNRSLYTVVQDPFSPQPVSVPYNRPKTQLATDSELEILQGEDFNRKARGWCPVGQSTERTKTKSTREESFHQQTFRQEPPPAPPLPMKQENYNRKIRAWNTGPQQTSRGKTEKSVKSVSSVSESSYGTYPGRNQRKTENSYSHQMPTNQLPGSDL